MEKLSSRAKDCPEAEEDGSTGGTAAPRPPYE
eukprot:CAMPEP_0206224934 /NCGR_PEP_ID=MMETSP0047_2-20121206/7287_1 /ASSEMBLY_ACC=CAM_ASM_000192 /TAXON_ID=195065 /ORGANISM="Chroomonas mesostigmatica_cf, Strain CCMP1168" /LENGTH=31 /DNA_ID= /DNA_START= /DNA_END= /DNA_ORIENTATION=